jgi:cytochrome c-type biogenesis protein CcmE
MLVTALILAGVAIAVGLALRAFDENLLYFYSPSQVAAGEAPAARKFRLGGLVSQGSVTRAPGSLEVRFEVTDMKESMNVSYTGVLPDLFREGQGVIAYGVLMPDGTFRADEVLAKHDENYMPPEVAEALQAQGHPGGASTVAAP